MIVTMKQVRLYIPRSNFDRIMGSVNLMVIPRFLEKSNGSWSLDAGRKVLGHVYISPATSGFRGAVENILEHVYITLYTHICKSRWHDFLKL